MPFKIYRTFLNKFNSSFFFKNAITLVSSTAISQVLPIITAPILTRIYSPDDYGTLGIFLAVSYLFGVFSTLGYANAVMIEKDELDSKKVFVACIYNSIFVSFLSLVLIYLFKHNFTSFFQLGKLPSHYLFMIPFSILMTGINSTLSVWANKKGLYKRLAFSRVGTAVLTPLISILYGFLYHNLFGLILGIILGQLTFTLVLIIQNIKDDFKVFSFYTFSNLKNVYSKNLNFFLYSLPADFINSFINQIPVFMLSSLSGNAVVGQYNMSNRMLGLPSSLISNSVGEIFKQKATEDFHNSGSCILVFKKTLIWLFCISLPIFLIIFLFGPEMFSFVFGSKWKQAGEFSRIMTLMFFFRFFVSPLTYTFIIKQKQMEDFIGHIVMLIVPCICYGISHYLISDSNGTVFLKSYTVGYSIIYIYYLIRSYQYASN